MKLRRDPTVKLMVVMRLLLTEKQPTNNIKKKCAICRTGERSGTVGFQQKLPDHDKWTIDRLRLAEGLEVMRSNRLRP